MKTKFILTLLLLASFAYEASAFQIIISGGTRNHKYNYVYLDDNTLKCTGRGSNECPIRFVSAIIERAGRPYSLSNLTDFVLKQVESGYKSGNINYEGALPVSWQMIDDENVQIDIDGTNVSGLVK